MNLFQNSQTNWKYLLIVIVLAVAVCGIWYYQYSWLPKHEIKPPEITITDKTADWQTYRNEEYEFEVKYPQGWKFKAISDQVTQFGTNEEFLGVYQTPPNHIQAYQSVNDLPNNDQGLDFNSWINKQIANGLFYDKKTIIISDIQGVEVIDRGIINFRNILVKKGEYIYSIVVNQDHSQMNIFDQILSTFKFISQ